MFSPATTAQLCRFLQPRPGFFLITASPLSFSPSLFASVWILLKSDRLLFSFLLEIFNAGQDVWENVSSPFYLCALFSTPLPRPPTPCKIIFPEKDFVNKKLWPADDLYVCIISNLLCFASVTLTTRKTCVPACLCVSFGPVNSLCYLSFTDLWLVVSYLTNIFLLINQASCFSFLIKCKDCFVMESAM